MRGIIVAMALMLLASSKLAAQTTFGGTDCGRWVKSPNASQKQWLAGYMSGVSTVYSVEMKKGDPLGKIDSADQMFLWVDNYCKAHPLEKVQVAGWLLFNELTKDSLPNH